MLLKDQDWKRLNRAAYEMRKDILDLCLQCGAQKGHLGGCMSAVELLAVLYLEVMNITEPEIREKKWELRDRFVMSKGHAGIAMYAALRQAGVLSSEDMKAGIRGDQTILYRHPKYNPAYGIECSVGSLGMGIGYAVGLAEAARRKKADYVVYAMVGDGECDEGSVWESLAYAAHRHLDNFVVIVDKNGLQLDGRTQDVLDMDSLAQKTEAFGFCTVVTDGHDFQQIYNALKKEHFGRPLAVIADTVKGKGVSFAENKTEWHDNFLTETLYHKALLEIEQKYQEFHFVEVEKIDLKRHETSASKVKMELSLVNRTYDQETIKSYSEIGCKDIVGVASKMIADADCDFALLYSDCANRIGIGELLKAHPEKCYEMGIAEQNQLTVAAALALEGYDVFAVAYAPFITARVLDQIRVSLGYMKAPVKLIGLMAGFATSDLGATHTALEDISNLRGIPNMTVICPADCLECVKAMIEVARWNKPIYLRITSGMAVNHKIYNHDYEFRVGKAVILREGADVAIFGCGSVLYEVLRAAELLESRGISCRVINVHTVKPLDTEVVRQALDMKLLVTVEEHNIIGGLGSAVSEYLAEYSTHGPLIRLGIPDTFYIADLPDLEMKRAGLTYNQIAGEIERKLSKIRGILADKAHNR